MFYCKQFALRTLFNFLKILLSTFCLLLVGSLSVSVFSPEIHAFLFHGEQACPHAHNGKPCSSHGEKSSTDDFGTCAVVLFGESSEHFFTLSDSCRSQLLDLGVSNLDSNMHYFAEQNSKCRARGPPELI